MPFPIKDVPAGAAIAMTPGVAGTMQVQYYLSPNGAPRQFPNGSVFQDGVIIVPLQCFAVVAAALTSDGTVEWNWAEHHCRD